MSTTTKREGRKTKKMGHQMLKSSKFGSCNLFVVVVVVLATTTMRSTVVDGYYGYNSYSPPPSYNSYSPPSTSFKASKYWKFAHATFYGDESGSETMGGACGYGNLHDDGYGMETAALSSVMFNNGKACGTCYEVKCAYSKWCYYNGPTIKVTATNLCPPNWYKPSDAGGWCNPPRAHFDLSKPMFMKMAQAKAGIVPVKYRRVPCVKQGGMRFKFQGNPYWLLVYVMNVGGSGDVSEMWVKGSNTGWISMSQNWGASYQAFSKLGGQSLSFKIKNGVGQILVAYNVAPSDWCTGKTYQASVNFY